MAKEVKTTSKFKIKKFKIKDTKALYVKKVENPLYCDFCEQETVVCVELEDENATQICENCVSELQKVAKKIFTKTT